MRDEIDSLGGRSHPPALSLMRYLPQPPPQVGKQFSMLGLGDIVIPGTTHPPTPSPPPYKREQALEPPIRGNKHTHERTHTQRHSHTAYPTALCSATGHPRYDAVCVCLRVCARAYARV